MWLDLSDIDPRDTADGLQHRKLKFETQPLAPFPYANFSASRTPAGLDTERISLHFHTNFAGGVCWRRVLCVPGTDNVGLELRTRRQDHNLLALARLCTFVL